MRFNVIAEGCFSGLLTLGIVVFLMLGELTSAWFLADVFHFRS